MDVTATSSPRGFFGWRVVGTAFVFAVFAWGINFYPRSVSWRPADLVEDVDMMRDDDRRQDLGGSPSGFAR
jgi:hypothetical protein